MRYYFKNITPQNAKVLASDARNIKKKQCNLINFIAVNPNSDK